jgi:ceramide glucosyltransferase
MSNILNMLPEARHDILVFADSDVEVEPDYLRRVIGELHQPGVGLVTCLYRGQPDSGFWGSLSADASNYQFLPSVVLGLALGMARPCFGQTLAMRRTTLEKIGGFSQFVHHLAEDHAIGEAVRLAGEKVVVPAFAVTHACVEKSAAEFVAHELRWSRTIRTVDPAGHLGSVLTHPLAFALLSVVVSGGATWAWTTVGAAIVARFALKVQMNKALKQPFAGVALVPIWDLVLFAVYLLSFFSSRVVWRGFNFTVGRDGLLIPVVEK